MVNQIESRALSSATGKPEGKRSVVPKRYRSKQENDGTWTVYDVFTGQPYVFGRASPTRGYTCGEARDVAYLLNTQDALRRGISVWPEKET